MIPTTTETTTSPAEHTLLPRKGVHFQDHCRVILVRPLVELEDGLCVEDFWYQSWERSESKRELKREAKEWRRSGLGVLLHDTFSNPNPKQVQACLDAFVRLSDDEYCRGAERFLSQQHDQQRVERKKSFVHDVIEQARYLESIKNMSQDEKMEKLAEFSALQSKCAAVFARRIGRADETAIVKGEDPSAAAKLVAKLCKNEFRRARSVDAVNVMPTHESKGHRRFSMPSLSNNIMMGI